jgi:hypothetical protein
MRRYSLYGSEKSLSVTLALILLITGLIARPAEAQSCGASCINSNTLCLTACVAAKDGDKALCCILLGAVQCLAPYGQCTLTFQACQAYCQARLNECYDDCLNGPGDCPDPPSLHGPLEDGTSGDSGEDKALLGATPLRAGEIGNSPLFWLTTTPGKPGRFVHGLFMIRQRGGVETSEEITLVKMRQVGALNGKDAARLLGSLMRGQILELTAERWVIKTPTATLVARWRDYAATDEYVANRSLALGVLEGEKEIFEARNVERELSWLGVHLQAVTLIWRDQEERNRPGLLNRQ